MTQVDSEVIGNDVVLKKNGKGRTPAKHLATIEEQEKLIFREKREFSVRDTFGLDLGNVQDDQGKDVLDANGKPTPKDINVTGFVESTALVPKIDPGYIFPMEETMALLLGKEMKDRILLVGGTGTGKSSILEQVAARLNYNCIKINFDGAITRQDLIGEWVIKGAGADSGMEFQYGILVHAFKMPGTFIILDEWDTISGECAFVLQRPLQKDDGKLLVMETGGELVPLHEDNIIAATANTCGQGDDTGLYSHGTKVQNYSQLNRFGTTIKMTYLPPDKETEMLLKRFPDLTKKEAEYFVQCVNTVRDAYSNNTISVPLSPRDLINWVEKTMVFTDPMKTAKYCFLNRMSDEDAMAVEQILKRVFKV